MIHGHESLQEGITALWKGIRPALLAAAPTVGIYMPLYDTLRDKLQPSLGYATPLVAGATARTVAVFCVAPLEVLRTRLMASTGRPALAMVRSAPGTCICVAEVPELPPTPAARMWMQGLPATVRKLLHKRLSSMHCMSSSRVLKQFKAHEVCM